jgi:multisubunit Na+/H+ antiporter MnhE subunit
MLIWRRIRLILLLVVVLVAVVVAVSHVHGKIATRRRRRGPTIIIADPSVVLEVCEYILPL